MVLFRIKNVINIPELVSSVRRGPHPTSHTPIKREHNIATESVMAVKCGYFDLRDIKFLTLNSVVLFYSLD